MKFWAFFGDPRERAKASSLCKDQQGLEKLGTGATSLLASASTEFFIWGGLNELPTLESVSVCSALPIYFFCDFLKATTSRKVLYLLVRSISNLTLQGNIQRLRSRQTQQHTTRLPAVNRNDEKSIRGIPNYGQTCFLNSVLQALASLPSFLQYLDEIVQLRERDSSREESKACFSRNLLQMLKCINGDIRWSDCSVGPRDILCHVAARNCQFSGRQQQDAQELFEALINIVLLDAQSVDNASCSFAVSLEQANENSSDEILTAGIVLGSANRTINELHNSVGQNDVESESSGQETQISFSQTEIVRKNGIHQKSEGGQYFRDTKYCSPRGGALKISLEPGVPTPVVPFNGWVGSILRCCKCKFIRPIRNSPFLSIPLVPTSALHHNSSIQRQDYASTPTKSRGPICSLEECLSNYTSIEHVNDVECPQCTMLEEIKELKDEQILLRDAIISMEKRRGPLTSHNALRKDLSSVEDRLSVLAMAYPDNVYVTSIQSEHDNLGLPIQGKALLRSGALKCLTLTRYPKVLCCHVQRLFVDLSTGKAEKCSQHVQFPQHLDPSRYCAYCQKAETSWAAGSLFGSKSQHLGGGKSPVYSLKGVIEHIGSTNLGHYVTFREDGCGRWFRISDSSVTQVHVREVRNCQAYMLFYELNVEYTS